MRSSSRWCTSRRRGRGRVRLPPGAAARKRPRLCAGRAAATRRACQETPAIVRLRSVALGRAADLSETACDWAASLMLGRGLLPDERLEWGVYLGKAGTMRREERSRGPVSPAFEASISNIPPNRGEFAPRRRMPVRRGGRCRVGRGFCAAAPDAGAPGWEMPGRAGVAPRRDAPGRTGARSRRAARCAPSTTGCSQEAPASFFCGYSFLLSRTVPVCADLGRGWDAPAGMIPVGPRPLPSSTGRAAYASATARTRSPSSGLS